MIAELKEISTLEIEISLQEYLPRDIYNFSLDLDLIIGPRGDKSGEYFSITVATFEYLNIKKTVEFQEFQRRLLIVDKYDYKVIEDKLSLFISTYSGDNWEIIAKKLSEVFLWEFENYEPYIN